MPTLHLRDISSWTQHPQAAPRLSRDTDTLIAAANGSRTLAGGWHVWYEGVTPGQSYSIAWPVECTGIDNQRDAVQCTAHWGQPQEAGRKPSGAWDYLLPTTGKTMSYQRQLVAPEGAQFLTLRATLRWTQQGTVRWSMPQIQAADSPPALDVTRIAVVTGTPPHPARESVDANTAYYAELCRQACSQPLDLIALPEVALQWRVPGHPLDLAVTIPSPQTDVFAGLARQYRTHIVLGAFERDGDAVFNSALLFGPSGDLLGRYHKVHLAVGDENECGILPGDDFPVFSTAVGRIGCTICMDVSAAESARLVGLGGADVHVLPIMGDHRADRWSPGAPIFNEGRWQAIMRTRALDTQTCLVVARNEGQGSCIIDRKGDLLAYNDGDKDHIIADLSPNDGYRSWNGGCFRSINWMQRRPHLYGAYTAEDNVGSLTPP